MRENRHQGTGTGAGTGKMTPSQSRRIRPALDVLYDVPKDGDMSKKESPNVQKVGQTCKK